MNVLVINAGSSSLKYQVINMADESVIAKGLCEKVGCDDAFCKQWYSDDNKVITKPMKNHLEAMAVVIETLVNDLGGLDMIDAIGHRVVHGGEKFDRSVLVDDQVLADIEALSELAPLHYPPALNCINACQELMPGVPNAVVFDTAFHQTLAPRNYMYALPYEFYERYGIRKYGAHGTSHRYIAARTAELLDKPLQDLKIITCHLGNGSSISAVMDGKCFDTTMGVTPLEGIMMGTRCGSIDPAIVPLLMKKEGLSPDQIDTVMNKKSGMLGITGDTSDNRTIEARSKSGDKKAQLVENMLCHQLTKYVGGFAAAMGGVDAIVFTGGIGENNPQYRDFVCDKLAFMGVKIDYERNGELRRGKEGEISTTDSKIRIFVVCTNEELMIAKDTKEICEKL